MGPMVEVVVVAVVVEETRATASSRATEATTRAPTAAPAPTTREVMAALVSLTQVGDDSVTSTESAF